MIEDKYGKYNFNYYELSVEESRLSHLFYGQFLPMLKLAYYGDFIMVTGRHRNTDTMFFLGMSSFKDCDTGETFEQRVMSNG